MKKANPHPPRTNKLLLKVYLTHLTLILLSATVFIFIARYLGQQPLLHIGNYVISTISSHWNDPQAMQARAREVEKQLKAHVTFYDNKNNLIMTTADEALPPLAAREKFKLQAKDKLIYTTLPPKIAVNIHHQGTIVGYCLMAATPPITLQTFALAIGLILIISSLYSFIFARSLALPISHLSARARAFGLGDFSARTRLDRQDELGYLSKTFDEMADKINKLLLSQKELLANISHELRTPLARMRVALDIAAEDALESTDETWQYIKQDLAELEQLINDVLFAARMELKGTPGGNGQGLFPLHREPLDLQPFLQKVIHRFRQRHESHHLDLQITRPTCPVEADPMLMRRVLDNLLDNARKYSKPGSTITIHARSTDMDLSIEITDQGIGIDPKEIKHIFSPFYQIDQTRSRSVGGIGIGLTLSRSIMEAHGGRITVTDSSSRGSTFHLSIPCIPCSKAHQLPGS